MLILYKNEIERLVKENKELKEEFKEIKLAGLQNSVYVYPNKSGFPKKAVKEDYRP